ncbi:Uncharacterised protein [Mycobacteroides abscessus subsp. massiliense]|nr:Uncharacterised protein [Mycobacteroides abscessus subsp. massiliense]
MLDLVDTFARYHPLSDTVMVPLVRLQAISGVDDWITE